MTRLSAAQALAVCVALEDADPDSVDELLAVIADRLYAAGRAGRSVSVSPLEGRWLVASIEADRDAWPARQWRSLDSALARLEVATG